MRMKVDYETKEAHHHFRHPGSLERGLQHEHQRDGRGSIEHDRDIVNEAKAAEGVDICLVRVRR